MPSPQSRGGQVMAIRQRAEALASYYDNPNKCLSCGTIIEVPPNGKVFPTRLRKFCDHHCSARYLNLLRPSKPRFCKFCSDPIEKGRVCRPCVNKNAYRCTAKEMAARGMTDPATQSARRYKQLEVEQTQAKLLVDAGWEIFSPTVVCDRVGVKDGKVYFIEFKPKGRERLRPGQKRIQELVPDGYIVVAH